MNKTKSGLRAPHMNFPALKWVSKKDRKRYEQAMRARKKKIKKRRKKKGYK